MRTETVKSDFPQRLRQLRQAEGLSRKQLADRISVTEQTVARWERVGKIRKPKRDWRGWRVYDETDLENIREFHEAVFEV